MSINKVVLMGRLTASPELKQTTSGFPVCTFNLAVERVMSKEKRTDFIPCVAWRQTAEFVCKYFQKGSMAALVGEINSRSYEGKDGKSRTVIEVIVSQISFTGEKKSETPQTQPVYAPAMADFEEITDDGELPF